VAAGERLTEGPGEKEGEAALEGSAEQRFGPGGGEGVEGVDQWERQGHEKSSGCGFPRAVVDRVTSMAALRASTSGG